MPHNLYRLRLTDETTTLIRGLHPDLKQKSRNALQVIQDRPHSGKPLTHELSGLWSFRGRRFRVVYKIVKKEVQIITIGPRSIIYEETFRIIKKT